MEGQTPPSYPFVLSLSPLLQVQSEGEGRAPALGVQGGVEVWAAEKSRGELGVLGPILLA